MGSTPIPATKRLLIEPFMIYTVYILYSPQFRKIYIGQTSDLINRFYSHNFLGREWTARYRPWEVIYSETFSSRSMALKRERELKGGKGRTWIWLKIQEEFNSYGFISAKEGL
jgi:putative endonuclease